MENTKEATKLHSPLSYSLAGIVGGLLSAAVGHPLDTVKVRLQTADVVAQSPKFKGAFDCIFQTVRKEGAMALFKGLSPHLLISVPCTGAMFLGYGIGLKMQSRNQNFDEMGPLKIFNAGLVAGVFGLAVVIPSYQIKCQLQVQTLSGSDAKYKGPFARMAQIYRQFGIQGLYKGTVASCLTLPAFGCYYLSYEYLLRLLVPKDTTRENAGSLRVLFAGGLAGLVWWTVGLPGDAIVSRIWTAPEGTYPRGIRDVVKRLVQNEGVFAFYKGFGTVVLKAVPESAALFWGYEITLNVISWLAKLQQP